MSEASLQGIWTQVGLGKETAYRAGGTRKALTHVAVGDGNGSIPSVSASHSGLTHEVWRGLVNAVMANPDDPTDLLVDMVIPNNVGGFWIREWGIFDEDGDLVAVGPHDEMHKPLISSGQAAEFLERFHLPSANAGFVKLTIATQALATQQYVESKISAHDEELDAHKALARKSIEIHAGTGLTGGGTLAADRTLAVDFGSEAGEVCEGDDSRLTAAEEFRLSMIGVPRFWRSTTLPENHVWCNGDLALFADWPELKTVYDAGGFSGMLLAYDANSSTIAANLGKWRPNRANPTGLFVPNLSGQFFRAWTRELSTQAGSAHPDTARNATGFIDGNLDITSVGGVFSRTNYAAGPATGASANTYHQAVFNLEAAWGTEHTAGEFAPVHVIEPCIIYLGRAVA